MAYSELIKNFEKVRSYMRDFYVYGFRGRDEFDSKSARIYDDEYRRVKAWLEGYIDSYYDENGKKFIVRIFDIFRTYCLHILPNIIIFAFK